MPKTTEKYKEKQKMSRKSRRSVSANVVANATPVQPEVESSAEQPPDTRRRSSRNRSSAVSAVVAVVSSVTKGTFFPSKRKSTGKPRGRPPKQRLIGENTPTIINEDEDVTSTTDAYNEDVCTSTSASEEGANSSKSDLMVDDESVVIEGHELADDTLSSNSSSADSEASEELGFVPLEDDPSVLTCYSSGVRQEEESSPDNETEPIAIEAVESEQQNEPSDDDEDIVPSSSVKVSHIESSNSIPHSTSTSPKQNEEKEVDSVDCLESEMAKVEPIIEVPPTVASIAHAHPPPLPPIRTLPSPVHSFLHPYYGRRHLLGAEPESVQTIPVQKYLIEELVQPPLSIPLPTITTNIQPILDISLPPLPLPENENDKKKEIEDAPMDVDNENKDTVEVSTTIPDNEPEITEKAVTEDEKFDRTQVDNEQSPQQIASSSESCVIDGDCMTETQTSIDTNTIADPWMMESIEPVDMELSSGDEDEDAVALEDKHREEIERLRNDIQISPSKPIISFKINNSLKPQSLVQAGPFVGVVDDVFDSEETDVQKENDIIAKDSEVLSAPTTDTVVEENQEEIVKKENASLPSITTEDGVVDPVEPAYQPIEQSEHLYTLTKKERQEAGQSYLCQCASIGKNCSTNECLNRLMHWECPRSCRVDGCRNRRFANREYAQIKPFYTGPQKGWGIKATELIKAHEFIIEYVGECVKREQFERRTKSYAKNANHTHHYMFEMSTHIIDATVKGNCSRFINHSCDPNAMCDKWQVPKSKSVRCGFFALRDIQPGEEITFDYQFQNYGKPKECYCGSKHCKGIIGTIPDSRENYEEDEDYDSESDEEEELNVSEEPLAKRRRRDKHDMTEQEVDKYLDTIIQNGCNTAQKVLSLTRCMTMMTTMDQKVRAMTAIVHLDTNLQCDAMKSIMNMVRLWLTSPGVQRRELMLKQFILISLRSSQPDADTMKIVSEISEMGLPDEIVALDTMEMVIDGVCQLEASFTSDHNNTKKKQTKNIEGEDVISMSTHEQFYMRMLSSAKELLDNWKVKIFKIPKKVHKPEDTKKAAASPKRKIVEKRRYEANNEHYYYNQGSQYRPYKNKRDRFNHMQQKRNGDSHYYRDGWYPNGHSNSSRVYDHRSDTPSSSSSSFIVNGLSSNELVVPPPLLTQSPHTPVTSTIVAPPPPAASTEVPIRSRKKRWDVVDVAATDKEASVEASKPVGFINDIPKPIYRPSRMIPPSPQKQRDGGHRQLTIALPFPPTQENGNTQQCFAMPNGMNIMGPMGPMPFYNGYPWPPYNGYPPQNTPMMMNGGSNNIIPTPVPPPPPLPPSAPIHPPTPQKQPAPPKQPPTPQKQQSRPGPPLPDIEDVAGLINISKLSTIHDDASYIQSQLKLLMSYVQYHQELLVHKSTQPNLPPPVIDEPVVVVTKKKEYRWSKAKDQEGSKYYYDRVTHETVWDLPDGDESDPEEKTPLYEDAADESVNDDLGSQQSDLLSRVNRIWSENDDDQHEKNKEMDIAIDKDYQQYHNETPSVAIMEEVMDTSTSSSNGQAEQRQEHQHPPEPVLVTDQMQKEFKMRLEQVIRPIISKFLMNIPSTDKEKKNWITKQLVKEMYKRESVKDHFDYTLTETAEKMVRNYTTRFMQRKCANGGIDLWKGYELTQSSQVPL